jgi:hypothetical protein
LNNIISAIIMKKTTLLLLLLTLCVYSGKSQATLNTSKSIEGFKSIPQEEVYVHYNTSLLFTGEYLYYKLYCLDTQTNNRSSISKMGYVEMVDGAGKQVFKHKVRLENGFGQGDFFLPPSVVSGNYKLLGYTQWMTNGEKDHFFHEDISVVNPYQENQDVILAITGDEANAAIETKEIAVTSNVTSKILSIELPSNSYGKRGLVALKLNGLKGASSYGDYSVSVRKLAQIGNVSSKMNAVAYKGLYKNRRTQNNLGGKRIALPELRGELISGQVTSNGNPATNVDVAFSVPGHDYLFKVTNTNSEGLFYINLSKEYDQVKAYAQVLNATPANYEIQFIESPSVGISDVAFHSFKISKAEKEAILERSIYNQVENGYFTVKTDNIQSAPPIEPFYGTASSEYNLDDFTRFRTLRETLVEVVDNAWVKNTGGGNAVFQVRPQDFSSNINALPLVMVDGVIVQDHNDLVDDTAGKYQKISILKDQYFLGSQVFQGVIDMKTVKGNFQDTYYKSYLRSVSLFKAQPQKDYFKPVYSLDKEAETKRIPDFRDQLLWMPSLKLNSDIEVIDFYTSDNLGTYEINIQGFTANGTPVSVTEIFVVRE